MMKTDPIRPCALAVVLVLALSACGGGNGGPGPEVDGDPEVGGGTAAQAYDKSQIVRIFDAEPAIGNTATYSPDDEGSALVELSEELDKSALRVELPDDYELIQGGAFHGVPVGMTTLSAADSGGDADVTKLGGWLEYNYFEARLFGSFDSSTGDDAGGAFAYSIGTLSGTNPTGESVTWKGASVGVDVRPNAAWPLVGEAVLTVDYTRYERFEDAAAIDIEINDLRRVDGTQASYDDLVFTGVPAYDGEFYDGPITVVPDAMNTSIPLRYHVAGAFFGPNHEEVGGVYVVSPTEDYREQMIVGAFGAKRTN